MRGNALYGEILAQFMNYDPKIIFDGRRTGSLNSTNAVSIPRFVLAGDYRFNKHWNLGVEIEFEADGFGTANWVASGKAGLFEKDNFTSPAYVARLNYHGVPGLRLGASVYYCNNTAANADEPQKYTTVKTGTCRMPTSSRRRTSRPSSRTGLTTGPKNNYMTLSPNFQIICTFAPMNDKTIRFDDLGVEAEYALFRPEGAVGEWHVMLHVEPKGEGFEQQLNRIYAAEDRLTSQPGFEGAQYVMKRYFLSDSANQQPLMRHEPHVAISIIQQQPLDGSKVAVWLYLVSNMQLSENNGTIVAEHNGYRHLWSMGLTAPQGDSAQQTETILNDYEHTLQEYGATLADNCLRTWFFVRDVDTQYAGMVKARRENFIREGLTEKTHYIASTGIGGGPGDTKALIQLGTYALTGFEPQQQHYLYAKTHLNPTYEYGVTFERGTAIHYPDRTHILISGTASIDNQGTILYEGDVIRQAERMMENISALLAEAGATIDDITQAITYLRDPADYAVVSRYFTTHYPHLPQLIVLAPVCRPGWLIETECWAVGCKI